jgi:hypothetical protein
VFRDWNSIGKHTFFGSSDDIDENFYLSEEGELRYSARVWHFAEWDGLMKFLETEFGLKNARWISDEDVDPFDVL